MYRPATLARLEEEYDRHHRLAVRRLALFTHNPDEAEDLVQEAFVRLGREIEGDRPPRSPGAWLNRVAVNLAISRARHQRIVDREGRRLQAPNAPLDPDRVAAIDEVGAVVAAGLAELSDDERLVVMLAAEGYRCPEIAVLIARTAGATRTLLCRARARLRRRLVAWELGGAADRAEAMGPRGR
jgi:RNA polymerase sigma-70 factor (ECF subfamily)